MNYTPRICTFMLMVLLLMGTTVIGALAIDTVHVGFTSASYSYPNMTDAIRLSTRINWAWWGMQQAHTHPENGTGIPYAYFDTDWHYGLHYTNEWDCAWRWNSIITGGGDPFKAGIGIPALIILNEINGSYSGYSAAAEYMTNALIIFRDNYRGGNREYIMAYTSPGVTQTSDPANSYPRAVYAAKYTLRKLCLETYLSHHSYVNGWNDPSGLMNPGGQSGDAYLNARLGNPIRRWTTVAGCPTNRIQPIIAIGEVAESHGTTTKQFFKFMNRCYYWMANGRYGNNQTGDAGIIGSLRCGVGSYKWEPTPNANGNEWGLYQLEGNRDTYFEKYLVWYCVGLNQNAHSDGIDAI